VKHFWRNHWLFVGVVVCCALVIGCSTIKVNPVGRAASDQMLNALSIEEAVNAMRSGHHMTGKVVRLEVVSQGIDKEYLESVIQSWILRSGGIMMIEDATPAMVPDLTFKVMAQTTGTDKEESAWSLPLALPSFRTGLTIAYIDLYRSDIQVGRCRLWGFGINPEGRLMFTQEPVYGSRYVSNSQLFGLSLGKRSDIPQLEDRNGTLFDQ